MARDDGLLIKPETRKTWVHVAVAVGVLALGSAGYFAFGRSGKPEPAAAGPSTPAASVSANADQLPAIIIAVLPLATTAPAAAGADPQGFAAVRTIARTPELQSSASVTIRRSRPRGRSQGGGTGSNPVGGTERKPCNRRAFVVLGLWLGRRFRELVTCW